MFKVIITLLKLKNICLKSKEQDLKENIYIFKYILICNSCWIFFVKRIQYSSPEDLAAATASNIAAGGRHR